MKLQVPGSTVLPAPPEESLSKFVKVTVTSEHKVSRTERSTGVPQFSDVEAEPDDVLELEYENGVKQWISAAQLAEDMAESTGTRAAAAPDVLKIPLYPAFKQRTRGVLSWVLQGLKILKVSPAEAVASASAKVLVEQFESKLDPAPGLYRLADPRTFIESLEEGAIPAGDQPFLVLIHGTASSISGSFGEMAGTEEWKVLNARYQNRIFGLQHRTLSVSPVQNAIDLARLLPDSAKLHLISHSRGGLVGELLCAKPFTDADLEPFREGGREADAAQLEMLSNLLAQKRFQVERFVRVACPARGTILASNRLDRYLSLLLNAIGMIPFLKASSIYDFVKATLLEFAKRRTQPAEIPGLEAQMPESPLINLLNRPGMSSQADLGVIAGDIEGSGFWGHLKVFATDLFYKADHDLVVDTKAMYAGLEREGGAFYFFDKGPDVNHFSYFRNSRTRTRLVSWLTQADGAARDPQFLQLRREAVAPLVITRSRAADALPVLFVLPGIMGSHLRDKNGRVWLHFGALTLGHGFRRLEIGDSGIEPDGLVDMAYGRFCRFAQGRHDIILFPYDWRLSVAAEAERLAKSIKAELARHDRSIRIVAHSMGGLVARAMIAKEPDLWEKVCNRGGRLVMLGTPNRGSYVIPRLLFGVHPTLRMLALASFRTSTKDLAAIVGAYPGVLEMLPDKIMDLDPDFFEHAWWKGQKGATTPDKGGLKKALDVRTALAAAIDPQHMIYVAGSAPETPRRIVLENGRVEWVATTQGDGTVPYDLGRLPKVRTFYVSAKHGDLANHPASFGALLELLETGDTNKLPVEPPVRVRGAESTVIVRDNEPLLFPTEEEILSSAMGAEVATPSLEQVPPLQVIVAHGDLRQASYPVAIGHYQRDTIVSAEAHLDRQLNGRLSQRFQMDLYPGPVATAEAIIAPGCTPPGALVIGLGEVGEINPDKVRRGVTEAVLKLAIALSEDSNPPPPGSWRSAAFSAVLLGTRGGNALSVPDAVAAIVQGALDANRVLREHKQWERVRVDAVQLIELYEDIAVEALRAARNLDGALPSMAGGGQELEVVRWLQVLEGGRFQRPVNQYVTGWSRRIQITDRRDKDGEPGGLEFVVLTDRARAEETLSATQRPLIDQFVESVIQSPGYNEADASTMYELLIPNVLKDRADEGAQSLVLVVDRESARYPWELLGPRSTGGVKALSLKAGLIRQFRTSTFRAMPRVTRELTALVVGDTLSGFAELPGAQREAEQVAQILAGENYAVRKLIKTTGVDLVRALFGNDYKIMHLAGHGEFNANDPQRSGMILGNGVFLTAAELERMRTIPELVFLNCCHLGRITEAPHKLAASVSEALINIGVKAVIAAGWAVDDAAAMTFAAEFYGEILSGETFGNAVLHARQRTFERHGETNTWGAYQCYGNPEFRLDAGKAKATRAGTSDECLSRSEFLAKFKSIASAAKGVGAGVTQVAELRESLENTSAILPAQWSDGEMLADLGDAWAEIGDFGKAIESYRRAVFEKNAQVPIHAIEQLANLQVRYATELMTTGAAATDGAPDPAKMMDEALSLVEWLLALGKNSKPGKSRTVDEPPTPGETPERYSLLGGTYKRRALLARGKERKQMLTKARDAYGKAKDLALRVSGVTDPYSALNWITYRLLLGDVKNEDLLAEAQTIEKELNARSSAASFWSRVGPADALLVRTLIEGDLPAHVLKIKNAYRSAVGGGATERERESVRDHIAFLANIISDSSKKSAGQIATALREIAESI